MAEGLTIELKLDGFAAYREQAHAALQQALEAEAAETVADAKLRAPVKTGALRDSLAWEAAGELAVTVHDGVSYGVFQEFGTRFAPAQPFFTPALDQATERFPGRVKAALDALEGEKLL